MKQRSGWQVMRNGIFAAISVKKKKRMLQSSAIAATVNGELVSLEGGQEGKNTCCLAVIRLQQLPTVSPEETQDVKTQDSGHR